MTWWPFSTARREGGSDLSAAELHRRLTSYIHEADALRRTIANLEAINDAVCIERDEAKAALAKERAGNNHLYKTAMLQQYQLGQIIKLDTPRASHTVKKAVAIARGDA